MVWLSMVWLSMVWLSMVWLSMVWLSMVWAVLSVIPLLAAPFSLDLVLRVYNYAKEMTFGRCTGALALWLQYTHTQQAS